MTDYQIVTALTKTALTDAVVALLATWTPLGAPFFDHTSSVWCQAMTQ